MPTVPMSAATSEAQPGPQPSPELLLMAAAQMNKMGKFNQNEAIDKIPPKPILRRKGKR